MPDDEIEFGFIGDDIDTLRRLTQAAEDIMWRTPGTANIRNSWGNRVPTWLPLYSQMKGQRIGVTRSQMAQGSASTARATSSCRSCSRTRISTPII